MGGISRFSLLLLGRCVPGSLRGIRFNRGRGVEKSIGLNPEFFQYTGNFSGNFSGSMEKFILLNMSYVPRLLEDQLRKYLFKGKVLVITGARQVGKTTLIRHLVQDLSGLTWLNADDLRDRERLWKAGIPEIEQLLSGTRILVIDEIQRIENAGLLLKMMIDRFPDKQIIATGSSALEISETIFEPLTGRHFLFHLFPFGLSELYPGLGSLALERELPFHLVFGSYPAVTLQRDLAEIQVRNLANQYLYKDVLVWKGIRKPAVLEKLLQLLAFQMGSEVSVHELAKQLQVKSETVEQYLDLLEKAFVIFRLRPFYKNERKEISKMTKVFFWDNGIRNAVCDRFSPLSAREDVGMLWENFAIAERMKWLRAQGSFVKSHFWRTYNQSEVDYLEVSGGQIHAWEMKWNPNQGSGKFNRGFLSEYADAQTDFVTPHNIGLFTHVSEA
jgi:hypothetical protein